MKEVLQPTECDCKSCRQNKEDHLRIHLNQAKPTIHCYKCRAEGLISLTPPYISLIK